MLSALRGEKVIGGIRATHFCILIRSCIDSPLSPPIDEIAYFEILNCRVE